MRSCSFFFFFFHEIHTDSLCFLCWMYLFCAGVWWWWGDVFAVVCIKLKRCSCPSGILCIGLVFPESLNKAFVVGKIEKERGIPQWGKVASEAEAQCSFFFPSGKKQWMTQEKWWKRGHASYWNTNDILPFCITHLLDDNCFPSDVANPPSAQGT